MPDRDTRPFRPGDIGAALMLLTRLPVPAARAAADRGARAAWAYPLAGLAVGLIAALVGWLAGALPPALAAGLMLAALVLATGALHEDGLADAADGLWGGQSRARRLEIMADSRIGSYGVVALVLSLGLRWAALASLSAAAPAALIGAAVLSRAAMPALMWALPNARGTGLSAATGRPSGTTAAAALGLAALAALPFLGATLWPSLLVLVVATAACGMIARARLGGQTGDVLGAAQQVAEVAILVALAA